jgi:hypothetical protein
VDHEPVRSAAVPVVLVGLEEDAVAGPDDLDRAALALAQADALGDEDRLAVRVRVPVGAAPGVKCTRAAANVEVPAGAATVSMYTSPVNPSAGPLAVSMLLRVICMTSADEVRP